METTMRREKGRGTSVTSKTDLNRTRRWIFVYLPFGLLHLGIALPGHAQGFDCLDDSQKNSPAVIAEDVVRIPLDNTGIATHLALNPRRPLPLIQPIPGGTVDLAKANGNGKCYDNLDKTSLRFNNLTDRFIGVQLSINLKLDRSDLASKLRDIVLQLKVEEATSQSDKSRQQKYDDDEASLVGCQDLIGKLNPLGDSAVGDLRKCSATLKAVSGKPDLEKISRDLAVVFDATAKNMDYLATWADGGGLAKFCKFDTATQNLQCTPKLIVLPNASQSIAGEVLNLLDKGTSTFTVSFENSADIPSNSTGYLQTAASPQEPANSTKWQVAAQVGAAWDPDTNKKFFDVSSPFKNKELQHFTGVGNFKLDQRLGNRAAATATLGFKKGDLGESDSSNPVKVPEYMVKLYGDNGLQLVFGKYMLAVPSDGISVNVAGEGLELQAGSFSLGHLIRRESASGEADSRNRDNRLYIVQMKNASFPTADLPPLLKPLRTASFVLLYGQEDDASLTLPASALPLPMDISQCKQPSSSTDMAVCYGYRYWTAGGEVAFSPVLAKGQKAPLPALSGTLAIYYSQRDLDRLATEDTGSRVRDGRGTAGLFKLNYSYFLPDGKPLQGKPKFTLGAQLGYGSRDNPQDRVDHSYIGESTAFAPDQIFLSRFAGNIGTLGGFNQKEHLRVVGTGLSNKTYVSGNWTWNVWSPLAWLAKNGFGITEAPNSQSTTLKLHYYRFNEPRFDSHDAGWEADLNFSVEVPKGVTTSVDFGYFSPGSALPEIPKKVWRIGGTVKATI